MMMRLFWLMALVFTVVLVACNDDDSNPSPTTEPTLVATEVALEASLTPTRGGPSLTPSSTFRPTVTPAPPSATMPPNPTAIPSETPLPYEYVVKEGDTCGEIAIFYDVSTQSIEQANGLSSCRILSPGQRLTIPRPTLTPTPFGLDATQTAVYEALPPRLKDVTPYALYDYCAVEGDTLTSISIQNGTTNRRVCELNSGPGGLDCRGCDFSQSSVGSCPNPPQIGIGQCLRVPGPTFTPPPSATPQGSPTITPTPTHVAPQPYYPSQGTIVSSAAVRLMWVQQSGVLQPQEYYLLTVLDEANNAVLVSVETRSTDFTLPESIRPASGEQRALIWTIEIVVVQNDVPVPVSGRSSTQRFVWQAP